MKNINKSNFNSKHSKIAIINGLVLIKDKSKKLKFKKRNILINNNKIKKVTKKKLAKSILSKCKVINAKNSYISYGFIDPHVHFRTPGNEQKENWLTGSKAAIAGGYTFVIDMPNNSPPAINKEILTIKNDIAKNYPLNYGFYIGLTDENANTLQTTIHTIREKNIPLYGIKVFLGSSTGNLLIKNLSSIKKALDTNEVVLFHVEDQEILEKHKRSQFKNVEYHNKQRPVEACVNGIKKIISSMNLNSDTNPDDTPPQKIDKCKIYICHTTSLDEIRLIKKYRDEGYNIIAEVTPHHLFFNIESLKGVRNQSFYKVNPPIRFAKDQVALQKYFNKGVFNIIGTDHAPHQITEKKSHNPPSGIAGLESSFYALYSLYKEKKLSLGRIFKSLTSGYKLFGIKKRGKIKKGYFADLTIIKKDSNIFKAHKVNTQCKFSPFDRLNTSVKIDTVIINGKILYENGTFTKEI